ncbi:MAG TPA: ROK family transcriptional regulator [Chthonomonadaceae bacterium]|nr:ROK family transcriptional regulator [Chthonomonadaceae bacterium]
MHSFANAPSLIQPSLLSRMNERQVLRAIQSHGPMSRAEVARFAGISAPTASKAVESLLRGGWLEEGEAPELGRGRPARKLRLPSSSAQVLGLVIDADQCRVVSAGLDGALCGEGHLFPTPATYAELLDRAEAHALRLIGQTGVRSVGMGISMPGLIDCLQQNGILSPNVPITNGHAPAADLSARLGIDAVLVQEAHALCLAERYYGCARGPDNFAMLDATTGVGLGVMSGGQLLTGNRGLAGEVGHITVVGDGRQCGCGNRGCLETVACDAAVAAALSRRLARRVTVQEIVESLANRFGGRERPPGGTVPDAAGARRDADAAPEAAVLDGDAVTSATDSMVEYVAIGVAAVINLFNPSTLFVHSRILQAAEPLFARVVDAAGRRALAPSFADCRIVLARGSKRQGAVAAIIEHLLSGLVPVQMRDNHYLGGAAPSTSAVNAPVERNAVVAR